MTASMPGPVSVRRGAAARATAAPKHIARHGRPHGDPRAIRRRGPGVARHRPSQPDRGRRHHDQRRAAGLPHLRGPRRVRTRDYPRTHHGRARGGEGARAHRWTAAVDERGRHNGGEGHAEGGRNIGDGGRGEAEGVAEHALSAPAGWAWGAGVRSRSGGERRNVVYRGYSPRRSDMADSVIDSRGC